MPVPLTFQGRQAVSIPAATSDPKTADSEPEQGASCTTAEGKPGYYSRLFHKCIDKDITGLIPGGEGKGPFNVGGPIAALEELFTADWKQAVIRLSIGLGGVILIAIGGFALASDISLQQAAGKFGKALKGAVK